MIGFLLINKPQGISSHDVVYRVRRGLGIKRVGHAGTLDPIATGLLVVAVGPATRFLQYLDLEPKVYEVVVRFGETTPTYDTEAAVEITRPLPDNLFAASAIATAQFTGSISQLPPMFSAVKLAGKPLYQYARSGQEVERRPRQVFIKSFEALESVTESDVRFRIVCSGGTYVRTLAHDLGEALGCGGHVIELKRTQVGRFTIEESIMTDEIPNAKLMPLVEALAPMPMAQLNALQVEHVREGRDVSPIFPADAKFVGLLDTNGSLISVAKPTGPLLHPECVIPAEAMVDSA